MGCPTKVQLIQRKESEQWYINFPTAVAKAMEFEKAETVEWIIEDKSLSGTCHPDRFEACPCPLQTEKNRPQRVGIFLMRRITQAPPRLGIDRFHAN